MFQNILFYFFRVRTQKNLKFSLDLYPGTLMKFINTFKIR